METPRSDHGSSDPNVRGRRDLCKNGLPLIYRLTKNKDFSKKTSDKHQAPILSPERKSDLLIPVIGNGAPPNGLDKRVGRVNLIQVVEHCHL